MKKAAAANYVINAAPSKAQTNFADSIPDVEHSTPHVRRLWSKAAALASRRAETEGKGSSEGDLMSPASPAVCQSAVLVPVPFMLLSCMLHARPRPADACAPYVIAIPLYIRREVLCR